LIEEIKALILALQDKKLKIGELEDRLNEYLNRNQIKYLLSKLQQDGILDKEGSGKGT
jgi:predicted HTH transcriptional regulator